MIIAVVFFILAVFARTYPYFSFDLLITRTLQSIDYPWFSFLMKWFSQFGNIFLASLSTVFIASLFFLFRKRKEAFLVLSSTIGLLTVGFLLKAVIARPRPDTSLVEQVEKFVRADSFPSGHVLFFVGLYGFLIMYFAREKKSFVNRLILGFFILLISLMGVSRIYVGAHWFSDVLGAYLLGFLWLHFIGQVYFKSRYY